VMGKDGFKYFKKGIMLRQTKKDGYLSVKMQKGSNYICTTVHRVVAENYMPEANFIQEVNHVDFDKKNNYLGNLEFCSKSRNLRHMVEHTEMNKKHNINRHGVSVVQLSFYDEYIAEFISILDASRKTTATGNGIRKCIGDYQLTSGGFKWMLAEEYYKK
ncbi:MAG: HNH endonuclease, partial [Candidatus Peribacteraceae bacterium]|nr:HNH endonuclease [Candidatus Peribacteraceae bacterium]